MPFLELNQFKIIININNKFLWDRNMAEIIIRKAIPDDSSKIIRFVNTIISEPFSNLEMSEGEFLHTEKEERKILADFHDSANSLYLIAEFSNEIIGNLVCNGSNRRASRHCVSISMSVAKTYRGKGIGKELMRQAIDWARNSSIVKRMDLIVFARNLPAIHLYESLGFEKEGVLRKSIYRDDQYLDAYIMALLL